MRRVLTLAIALFWCAAPATAGERERARAALALAASTCHDSAFPALTQEARWRADGWQRDAAGQWFRVVPGSIGTYQPAPVYAPPVQFYRPAFFGGGFGGACRGGG